MVEENIAVWEEAKERLSKKLPKHAFDCWIANIRFGQLNSGCLELLVPNDFHSAWLRDNYLPVISDTLKEVGFSGELVFGKSAEVLSSPRVQPVSNFVASSPRKPVIAPKLNPNYSFENFYASATKDNTVALEAARKLALADPLLTSSGLFLESPPGRGKTHLLHAIGNFVYAQDKSQRVVYSSAEGFTNSFLDALENKKLTEFRKIRQADVFLLDDLHFFAKGEKPQTVGELLYTFDALKERGTKIAVASNLPLSELNALKLNGPLYSRLERLLPIGLASPNSSDLGEILSRLASQHRLDIASLPSYVYGALLSRDWQNVRKLEGALIRAAAGYSLGAFNSESDFVEFVAFSEEVAPAKTFDDAVNFIAANSNVDKGDIFGKKRVPSVSWARHEARYLAHIVARLSYSEIGARSKSNHATIMHSCREVESRMKADSAYAERIRAYVKKFGEK